MVFFHKLRYYVQLRQYPVYGYNHMSVALIEIKMPIESARDVCGI